MSNQVGFLTIFSADRKEVYGEFADAEWTSEMTAGGTSNIFAGTASDGALKTFFQLDNDAISHVAYTFEANGHKYAGAAELLAPATSEPAHPQIRIETGETPILI